MSPSPDHARPPTTAVLLLTVLAPFALGYFLSYLFRSVNAVVAPDLVADIGLSAAELGVLTSAYLFAFALFQLPLGVLLDRFGPSRVQAALLTVAATGAVIFASADSLALLTFGRALIGLGFAGGLMSGFKAVVLWVPEDRRALANAAIMSFGALGIIVATVPTELAVQAIGWRAVFLGLAAVTVGVAILILVVVPARSGGAAGERLGDQIAALVRILLDRAFWRLAPLLAATAGGHIAIQTLWAGPWLRDIGGLDRIGVANHLMAMALGFMAGILISGAVADWLVRRGVDRLQVMLVLLLVFFVAELLIILETTSITLLVWVTFGMMGQVAILAYPWLASHYGAARSGRAQTAMNLLIFAAAFAAQATIGWIIDQFPATATGGYDPRGYQLGFGALLALQLLGLGWYLLPRRGN